jgi:fructuronate reductase
MPKPTLCQQLLDDKSFWEGKNVLLPNYDRRTVPVKSICFSAGRMAYGHTADILQDILNEIDHTGTMVGVETFASRYVADLAASDYLMTQIIYENEKGVAVPKVQGAINQVLFIDDSCNSLTWNRLYDYARDPGLQFATINAPEGAYGTVYTGDRFAEPVSEKLKQDLVSGTCVSDAAKWAKFVLARYEAGLLFSIVSCTNFSGNGHVTLATLCTIAKAWEEKGFAKKGFVDYLSDPKQFGCPNTMIDRIAVPADEQAMSVMDRLGIHSGMVVTEKTRYWVVEDLFPAGKPEFERAEGVIVEESYEEVKKYEDMKLRMLNMAHSTIAGLGVLLGYRGPYGIYRAMQDNDIKTLIGRIIDIVSATIERPKKMNPNEFARDTFERLNNPNIPDDPMRIALNGSTKMHPRFMDTYFAGKQKGISESELQLVLLPVAGFFRYTLGIDDKGQQYSLEDDPLKEQLESCGALASIGTPSSAEAFKPLIARKEVMGKDVYNGDTTGETVQNMIGQMLEGTDAVRKTLQQYLGG